MKKVAVTLFLFLLILTYQAQNVNACTTFTINDQKGNIVFGRNFDFENGCGHVSVNKKNLKKTALISATEKPLVWVSQYGSVTFNQAGKELPYGGMNEEGLVVEEMLLPSPKSDYPSPDERFGLTSLQWIQYQLDTAETVEDVIQSDANVRVAYASQRKKSTIHFLVSDRYGKTAVIEYIEGKMKTYQGNQLIYPVLANNTYDDSLANANRYSVFGGKEEIPSHGEEPLERFAIAAAMVHNYSLNDNRIDYAFSVLDSVAQSEQTGWPTQWSIVYDINALQIYYKTANNSKIRKVALSEFDFNGNSPSLFVDIDNDVDGRSDFEEYSTQANRDLIEKASLIPREGQEKVATYPESIESLY